MVLLLWARCWLLGLGVFRLSGEVFLKTNLSLVVFPESPPSCLRLLIDDSSVGAETSPISNPPVAGFDLAYLLGVVVRFVHTMVSNFYPSSAPFKVWMLSSQLCVCLFQLLACAFSLLGSGLCFLIQSSIRLLLVIAIVIRLLYLRVSFGASDWWLWACFVP